MYDSKNIKRDFGFKFVGNFEPFWNTWQKDLPAAIVVFLVALPLCLGIALASGAPLISGLVAGIVGGVVVGVFSRSPLSVSGPAAGLAVIVFNAIETLPSFEVFLLAVALGGVIQAGLGLIKAGVIGDFVPIAVIKGMLAAIGILIAFKQFPYMFGLVSVDIKSFTDYGSVFEIMEAGPTFIAFVSLAFLFMWDKFQPKDGPLQFVPGPLIVVIFGVVASLLFQTHMPEWTLQAKHLVKVPVSEGMMGFTDLIIMPDFSAIGNKDVWVIAVTLALVASIETLLSIKAVDKLDPQRRVTPPNRELLAQGIGNFASGMLGGLPVTSVIVRSSANVSAGAQNKLSAIVHGVFLFVSVAFLAKYLNYIPLSALAAVLIVIGYKLAHPKIFIEKLRMGSPNLIPFIVTIIAIVATDLLTGVLIGLFIGIVFVIVQNFQSAISFVREGDNFLIRCKKDIFFIHKYEMRKTLRQIPNDASVLFDISSISFMDIDNVEIINDFITNASFRNIKVFLKKGTSNKIASLLKVHNNETV
ncbi:MAG: SulP family inorganic anion transporter [Pseudomonadota bacterium]